MSSTSRSSSRARKVVERLVDTKQTTPAKKEWQPTPGNGLKMRDLPHVFKYINKLTRSDDNLMTLHKIFYGRRGLKSHIKPYTLDFCGLHYTEERNRDDVIQKLFTWSLPQLKYVMDNLGVNRSSKQGGTDKEGLTGRFCDWLEKPIGSDSNVQTAQAKKKEKKLTKKFKKAMALDKNKPKKGLSGYMFFGKARRSTITAANPEAKVTDIMKLVAQAWGELSDEDKVPYQQQADADKIRYQNDMLTYVPASPPLKKVKSKKKKKKVATKSTKGTKGTKKSSQKSASTTITVTEYRNKKLGPLFPHSRYMLTKNAPKAVKSKKKRKASSSSSSSSTSKRAKKKAKVESSDDEEEEDSAEESEEEEEESEEEEEEEEEVAVVELPVDRLEMEQTIRVMLEGADLTTLSIKAIRKQLAEKFAVDLKPVRDEIKRMIMSAVNEESK